jgi:hypothetical protein
VTIGLLLLAGIVFNLSVVYMPPDDETVDDDKLPDFLQKVRDGRAKLGLLGGALCIGGIASAIVTLLFTLDVF